MSGVKTIDIPQQPQEPVTLPSLVTPMDMLDRALTQGADISILTKLMDLQERYEKNQARKAFDAAISAAKGEIPVIGKNRKGHTGKYADFAAYARIVDPVLHKHGLSYRFRTEQDDRIRVTCVIAHSAGHFEENTLSGPADTSGAKNAIQAIGSTLTYLQRYTLGQALGLAASDDDDGKAAGSASGVILEAQAERIEKLIEEVGANRGLFLNWLQVETVEEIPQDRFDEAIKKLEAKRNQRQ